ncbi:DNA ligase [Pectobacterium phage Jarilo]|uniref:DNA ligase n=1 Tax=Pectobacterium phage Jarilo TaxID=2163634 RepID=A0A2S1GSW3_9CAUD|nr:DNA ligase [Pectobacterium phage Jarilo]AWD92490.1 DNA ligase [Pectobacterium phage Jarilo]
MIIIHLSIKSLKRKYSMQAFKINPYKAVSFNRKAVEALMDKYGYVIADTKYDGVRGDILVDNTADSLWLSRVGKEIPSISHLNGFSARFEQLLKDDRCIFPDGFMLDGELLVKGVDFNTGSGILRTQWLSKKNREFHAGETREEMFKAKWKEPFMLDTKRLKVALYAVLPLHVVESGEDHECMNLMMPEHVKAMLTLLNEYLPEIEWVLAESQEVYSMDELDALYQSKIDAGEEGLIVKDPLGFYKRGKKSGWWKMKEENEADGTIQGLVWGTEGLANEGKVIGFEVLLESGRVVNATNISKALMDEFTTTVETYREDPKHLQAVLNGNFPYHGWQCQITYMEETPDGSLRHPSFYCFRGTESNPVEKI